MQKIVFSKDVCGEVGRLLDEAGADKVFLLTDTVTHELCRPLLAACSQLTSAGSIEIGATDVHKDLETLSTVWKSLSDGGASRRSLLVCLGGGMVTDLGGFAAATFKRGIRFINIPTTLLAMVDASVGGKTGINFNGLKNEIGVFRDAEAVVIDTEFLRTLDDKNLRSGYAEMLKHSLLKDEKMWAEHVSFDLAEPDYAHLQDMVSESVAVKENVVTQDPHERGIRKALNLGHTVGHALESHALESGKPVLHGYAVAWGLAAELFLSCALTGFPTDKMRQTVEYITRYYGRPSITCNDYPRLLQLMKHDKKNVGGKINFTLLGGIGDIRLDNHAPEELLREAFDFLREG